MNIEVDQLVTQTKVASMKEMSLSLLAYHLRKEDAPKPVLRYGKRLYKLKEIINWRPVRDNRGRKKK